MVPLQPKAIQKIGGVLAVAWSDGREDFIPLEALRAACPCASCNGEKDLTGQTLGRTVDAASATAELLGWEFVGGYGLQPRWADGHSSGIFTYASLRQLGEAANEG